MTGSGAADARVLVVLADGGQAAFAAAVVATLAEAGARWQTAYGAGLGAQVATLAVLGAASECRLRWELEAERGCPVLRSRLDAAREEWPIERGVQVTPDTWTIPGWLADANLEEQVSPELAGVPDRLTRAGAASHVAVQGLTAGRAQWRDLRSLRAAEAGLALRAAGAFCGGWAPVPGAEGEAWCGGVAAALPLLATGVTGEGNADVICGFPVPSVRRPAVESVFALVQRRDEISAALEVEAWVRGRADEARIIAPSQASWAAWAGREGADLGLEYPLPWERNGELVGLVVRYGEFVARQVPR